MSLWVDKYRPNKLDFGLKQAAYLETLVKSEDFPHLLIHGPSGAGKKTRIVALLRELYGPGVERLRIEHQNFETPSKKKLEIMTIASNYHIELNPSDVGIYDRVVIQELIKNTASAQQIHGDSQRASFKVVLLNEVDKLTKDAQHALRRTMEKYTSTCRLILCSNSTSKIIPAIKSRCLSIRIPAPSADDIIQILVTVSKKEGCLLPMELARRITEKSNRNLRRALLLTEACKVKQYPFVDGQDIVDLDWEVYLKDTARMIVSEQTPKKLLEVRGRLYELLGHCIPPDEIFVGLLKELVKNCDGELKTQLTSLAASYEHRLNQGNKSIFHLEAFVAKFMSLYMKFMEETMGCGF
uniref:Replication factor C subunit 3 n=1 Tax=Lepeophtheirus salmonis TaxID=72036 RepID=D3PIF5_LEPSM|nr:Replication factor C subunit 3 [Lepeophtheirus salmonis]